MFAEDLDIKIVDSLTPPDQSARPLTEVRNGTRYFKVYVYLKGASLPFVKEVTYTLHSSLSPSERTVQRSLANPNCSLALWLWGKFEIQAVVRDVSGREYSLRHRLGFDRELKRSKSHSSAPSSAAAI